MLDESMRTALISELNDQVIVLSDKIWTRRYLANSQSKVWGILNEELILFHELYEKSIKDMDTALSLLNDDMLRNYCLNRLDEFPPFDLNVFLEPAFYNERGTNFMKSFISSFRIYTQIQRTRQFSQLLRELKILMDKLINALTTPNFSELLKLSNAAQ